MMAESRDDRNGGLPVPIDMDNLLILRPVLMLQPVVIRDGKPITLRRIVPLPPLQLPEEKTDDGLR
jgi:hypothetical protein